MQQQPQVSFPPPPYQQEQHPPPPYQQQQPQVNFPPPLPPGQNRGVFAAPLPHGQAPPQMGSKLDPIELVNILLRFVAVLMIFIATVIIGATKYKIEVDEYPHSYGKRIYTTFNLGSFSPIKYFLAANSIVLIYSAGTLLISISSMLMKNKQGNDTLRNKLIIMLFVAGDLVAVVFLFSAIGSAAGSKDIFTTKSDYFPEDIRFCDTYKDGFCDKWVAGIVMSMFAAVAYLLLQLLSVYSLTKMNNTPPTTTGTEIAFPSPVVAMA